MLASSLAQSCIVRTRHLQGWMRVLCAFSFAFGVCQAFSKRDNTFEAADPLRTVPFYSAMCGHAPRRKRSNHGDLIADVFDTCVEFSSPGMEVLGAFSGKGGLRWTHDETHDGTHDEAPLNFSTRTCIYHLGFCVGLTVSSRWPVEHEALKLRRQSLSKERPWRSCHIGLT